MEQKLRYPNASSDNPMGWLDPEQKLSYLQMETQIPSRVARDRKSTELSLWLTLV